MSFHSPAMPLPGGRPSRTGAGQPGPDTAADRFRARRRRLSRIRRRVLATGAVTFVALWGVIFDQLIHEHVTSVASQTATVAATSSNSAGTSASTGSSSSGSSRGAQLGEQLLERQRLELRHDQQRDHEPVMSATFTLEGPARVRVRFPALDPIPTEATEHFSCFGSQCAVIVAGTTVGGTSASTAARAARRQLLEWHHRFSRFEPDSELSRLNADPRQSVPTSPVMAGFVQMAVNAARLTGGLVDPTLVSELERSGYADHFAGASIPLPQALALAPPRRPAAPHPDSRWARIRVDMRTATVNRPVGLRIDSGGIAKGMFADILALRLRGHDSFVVDAGGDLAIGGTAARLRPVNVASPFGDEVLHTFELRRGAVATSGIGRRSWLTPDGPAHHLLDPATGRAAFTGLVQVTALAPRAVDAEALAKGALLSGPAGAESWLPHGGLVLHDDGHMDIFAPDRRLTGSGDSA